MHAVICIPTLLGAWKIQGGGAFYNNGGIYNVDKSLIEGLNFKNHNIRVLDQSRIGSILTGNKEWSLFTITAVFIFEGLKLINLLITC